MFVRYVRRYVALLFSWLLFLIRSSWALLKFHHVYLWYKKNEKYWFNFNIIDFKILSSIVEL